MCKIPNLVIEKWRNEKGIDVLNKDHWPAVKKLLNDPEYKWLKTTSGFV
jgi:ribonuclease HI